ncbi:hypothetical protein OAJ84_03750 [Candidatus Puniceispirillum sp.]|nr:hypothetical protein [Candidatus Puniceispirillum sp.]
MSSGLNRFLKRLHFRETLKLASPSILSIPLTLASVPLCLSSLGTASYGILLILFLLQHQSHVFLFGAEKNLIRSIVQKQVTPDNLLATMLIAFVYGGCLVAVIIILIMVFGVFDYLVLSTTSFALLMAGIPVHLLWTIQRSILQADEKFSTLGVASFGYMSAVQYMPLLVILVAPEHANISSFLSGVLVARLTVTALLFFPSWHQGKGLTFQQTVFFVQLFHYGKWMGVNQTIQIIFDGADRFLLSLFSTTSAVALYAIPLQVTQKLAIIPVAMAQVVFNRSVTSKKMQSDTYLRDLVAVAPFCAMIFLCVCQPLFELWLGPYFDYQIMTLAALLFIAVTFTSLNFITGSILESSGRARQLARYDLKAMIPLLIIMAAFTYQFGVTGTATAFILKEATFFALRLFVLKPLRSLFVEIALSLSCIVVSVCLALNVSFSTVSVFFIQALAATFWAACLLIFKRINLS